MGMSRADVRRVAGEVAVEMRGADAEAVGAMVTGLDIQDTPRGCNVWIPTCLPDHGKWAPASRSAIGQAMDRMLRRHRRAQYADAQALALAQLEAMAPALEPECVAMARAAIKRGVYTSDSGAFVYTAPLGMPAPGRAGEWIDFHAGVRHVLADIRQAYKALQRQPEIDALAAQQRAADWAGSLGPARGRGPVKAQQGLDTVESLAARQRAADVDGLYGPRAEDDKA